MRQQAIFNARLERLAMHAGNTNATLHIGSETLERAAFERHKIKAATQKAATQKLGARSQPLMLLLGLVSGGMAWIWAQWVRVTLMPGGDPLVVLVTDLSVGLTAVLLLRAILGLQGRAALLFQVMGMVAAVLLLHNMVHLWPEPFARVFPSAWVSSVLSQTTPMSVNLSAFAI